MAVAWSKLDVESLKTEHPVIYAAWEAAQRGEATLLELGSYERAKANLKIDEVIEKVTVHADAASNPRSESLRVLHYLYNTGGEDYPMPFRFHAPDIEFREGDEKIPLIVWLHGAVSGQTDNAKNANLNLA